jgi:hypothetical protein
MQKLPSLGKIFREGLNSLGPDILKHNLIPNGFREEYIAGFAFDCPTQLECFKIPVYLLREMHSGA